MGKITKVIDQGESQILNQVARELPTKGAAAVKKAVDHIKGNKNLAAVFASEAKEQGVLDVIKQALDSI